MYERESIWFMQGMGGAVIVGAAIGLAILCLFGLAVVVAW